MKNTSIHIRVSEEDKEKLQIAAEKKGVALSQFLLDAGFMAAQNPDDNPDVRVMSESYFPSFIEKIIKQHTRFIRFHTLREFLPHEEALRIIKAEYDQYIDT